MAGLTVSEKPHWKERLAVRFKAAVERIKARHPATFARLGREARARALESLGLAGPYADLEAIQAEEAATARRKRQVQRQLVAAVRGVPIEEVPDSISVRYGAELPLPVEVGVALERRQAAHLDALLADDEVGREVRRLEAEQERLLDTVWLACSPTQIRALWTKVGALLGDEPTALEAEALAIAPPEED